MTLCPQRTQPALRTSQWAVFPSSLCQSTHPLPWGHQQQHPHQEGLGNAQPGACWWRMVAMVSKEKGQLEPGMRNMSRAAWGARAGAGGPGRVGGDRGMAKGQAGSTQFPILPPTCVLHLPTACSPSPPVWSGWLWHRGPGSPHCPVQGSRGRALPASLCLHRVPCLAVTLPCAAACTGFS